MPVSDEARPSDPSRARRPLSADDAEAAVAVQIVMSPAVRAAVIEALPDGVSLRSLGGWRFRGLPEAVDLFQVDAADLPADFPPPRSATAAKERTS